ncbi:MAG TPA: NIPSNAP family protein [Bacteroidales bacterium]|nr:NIPSNAP family protein [Bacteroidales bacterium]
MQKQTKLKTAIAIVLFFVLASLSYDTYCSSLQKQQYYEIKIYHVSGKNQETMVDNYLRNVYLPALHRAGIPMAGVFKPVETSEDYGKLVYVFIPFRSVDEFAGLSARLAGDSEYVEESGAFCDASFDKPPYERLETVLLKAFKGMPQFVVPDYNNTPSERIYELRSYESATEAKAMKKIEMFNSGEIDIFKKLEFHPVFFAQVLAGSHMPNLMYMTTFSDMKSHDSHWKAFGESESWKKMSSEEEYQNTVSKANLYLLHPASYSDF